jgi:hypothetical protein
MKKQKSITLNILSVVVLTLVFSAIAHGYIFPQETKAILIDFSGYEKEGRMYFSPDTPEEKKEILHRLIDLGSERVAEFWGQKTCNPKYIYCDSDEEFEKFSSSPTAPAVATLKLGSYIIIREQGLDPDIIAHEISHAELYKRIGFYHTHFNVPAWFNEGLAMQVDHRNYFSEDTLRTKTDNFRNLPDIFHLQTGSQFQSGDQEQIKLNYLTAKHEVKQWYTREKLEQFIRDIKANMAFEEAYGR